MRRNSQRWVIAGLFLFSWFGAHAARAADDEPVSPLEGFTMKDFLPWEENPLALPESIGQTDLPPAQVLERTQAVLRHFEVPEEPDSQSLVTHLHGANSWQGVRQVMGFLDPHGGFSRFARPFEGPFLEVFQDPGAFTVSDFEVEIAPDALSEQDSFSARMSRLAGNPSGLPLKGLRIALDPGHMGGDHWDRITGKYVVDRRGRKLSEGVMAMQVALLLSREFERLGAHTLITRASMDAVTSVPYDRYELTPYARHELSTSRGDQWFVSLLETAPAGARLFDAFERAPEVQRIYSDQMRWKYFIHKADLWERERRIRAFDPDVTIVIHFDAHTRGPSPAAPHATKTYVPGGFLPKEFVTREDRRLFAEHLLNRDAWGGSVRLGRLIVRELSAQLGLDLQRSHGPNAVKVEDGVFARNLALTRAITGSAMTYLETLFYNHPGEFEALLDTRHDLEIDGRNYPYSERLAQIVRAVRDGVVKFATTPTSKRDAAK